VELNEDQARAREQIEASIVMRRPHLLTGVAGSGKTTLVQAIAADHASRRTIAGQSRVRLAAPTHKAAAVLSRKLVAAGLDIPCGTIHSMLSLRPKAQGDRQVFVRAPHARPIPEDLIFVDEASMLDSSLMQHIDRYLAGKAVVLIGDKAQIPPVGEAESRAFDVMPASHLDTICRQAEGNPIIAAASVIRGTQDNPDLPMDWSWAREARGTPGTALEKTGVFVPPRADVDAWLRRAMTCEAFHADPDFARYLCYTNDRVAEINTRIRRWIHGDSAVRPGAPPFLPGEMALMRSPLIVEESVQIATNEEVTVLAIESGAHLGIGTWDMKVKTEAGVDHDIHLPRDFTGYQIRLNEMRDMCKVDNSLWDQFHEFKDQFIRAQSIYAMTLHASQGSTFRFTFLDIPNVRSKMAESPLEVRRLLYTGATRASDGLVLVGV
jgi:exodeoxyribonuclease-5